MVIEHFKDGCWDAVYDRFAAKGRMLPDGLLYVASWRNKSKNICYQLMETDDPSTFDAWTAAWADLADFEIVPLDD